MNTVIFNSGQEVEPRDLMTSQLYLQNEIKDRSLDFISPGLLGTTKQYVYIDANNTLRFEPFKALNANGEVMQLVKSVSKLALHLGSDDWRLTTRGTLSLNEWGFTPGIKYYICAKYITKYTRPRAHVISQQGKATRLSSGIELYAFPDESYLTEDGVKPYVILGRYLINSNDNQSTLIIDGEAEYATIDPTKIKAGGPTANKTTLYNPTNLAVSFAEHIMALGSAVPTPDNPHGMDLSVTSENLIRHETYLHSPGFIGDITSVSSLGYMIPNAVSSGQDNLKIYNLNSDNNEFIVDSGVWLNSFSFGTSIAYIHFLDHKDNGDIDYAQDGEYTFAVNYRTGEVIATYKRLNDSDTTSSNIMSLPITRTSSINSDRLGSIILYSEAEYANLQKLELCKFTFKRSEIHEDEGYEIKPISYITPDVPRSNFVYKTDLRSIGSISPEMLQAKKDGANSVITFPDTIEVSKIKFKGTTVYIDSNVGLPDMFMQGFIISCTNSEEDPIITVNPGACVDATNSFDIYLTSPIKKKVFENWEPNTNADTAVGGLRTTPYGESTLPIPTDTSYSPALHIFVISTADNKVDIAIDSSETGQNILASADTKDYKYIRRVGSIYVKCVGHLVSETTVYDHYVSLFNSYLEGQTLCVQYSTPLQLNYDNTNHLLNTQTPHSVSQNFVANLTYIHQYIDAEHNNLGVTYPLILNGNSQEPCTRYISGSGTVDLPLKNGTVRIDSTYTPPTFYLLGYKDSRNG